MHSLFVNKYSSEGEVVNQDKIEYTDYQASPDWTEKFEGTKKECTAKLEQECAERLD